MNVFGRFVGTFFFPEDDITHEFPSGTQWTYRAFGTHITEREMYVLIAVIQLVFPEIEATFSDTRLDQLATNMSNTYIWSAFPTMSWEEGPNGIQYAFPLAENHSIINWKGREDLNDWARAFPLAVMNEIEELNADLGLEVKYID